MYEHFCYNYILENQREIERERKEKKQKEAIGRLQDTQNLHVRAEEFYYDKCCRLEEENKKLKKEIERLNKIIESYSKQ